MKGNEQADKHNSGATGVISKETIYLDFKERNINLLFGPLIIWDPEKEAGQRQTN